MALSHNNHDAGESSTRWLAVLAAGAAAIAYGNAQDGEFVFDDAYAILQNPDVRSGDTWWRLWMNDFWGFPIRSQYSHRSYRPLTILSFRMQVLLASGQLDSATAASMHRLNIGLHMVNSALLVSVCSNIFKMAPRASCIAGILFAIHPVHVEAVANVSGRAELLAGLFLMLCLLLYNNRAHANSGFAFISAVLLGLLALLCKETAAGALPLCVVIETQEALKAVHVSLRHHNDVERKANKHIHDGAADLSHDENRSTAMQALGVAAHHARCAAGFLAATALLFCFRILVHGGPGSRPFLHQEANPGAFAPRWKTRVLTLHYYMYWHLCILIWPSPLCCDWSHSSIPLVSDIVDPRAIKALAVVYGCLLMAAAWMMTGDGSSTALTTKAALVRRLASRSADCQAQVLALSLLVISLLPSSNLLVSVGFTVAERVLYIPSLGSCALAAQVWYGAWRCASRLKHKTALGAQTSLALVLVSVLIVGTSRCLDRAVEWKSAELLYRSGLEANPGNEKLYDLLATRIHNTAGNAREAEWLAQRAVDINPSFWHAHATLGQIRSAEGNISAAIANYDMALKLAKLQGLGDMADAPKVRLNLAMLLQDRAPAAAEEHLRYLAEKETAGELQAVVLVIFGAFLESQHGGRLSKSTHGGSAHHLQASRLHEAMSTYRRAIHAPGIALCADVAHIRLGTALVRMLRAAESDLLLAQSASAAQASKVKTILGQGASKKPHRWHSLKQAFARRTRNTGSAGEVSIHQPQQRGSSSWVTSCLRERGTKNSVSEVELVHFNDQDAKSRRCELVLKWAATLTSNIRCLPVYVASAIVHSRASISRIIYDAFSSGFNWQIAPNSIIKECMSDFPPHPTSDAALWHLQFGLSLPRGKQSAGLDLQDRKRAEAFALAGARLSRSNRVQEAAALLAPIHRDPASALVYMGQQRLAQRDLAAAHEAFAASAQLSPSATALAGLADVLHLSGDSKRAARYHAQAAKLQGMPVAGSHKSGGRPPRKR